MNATEQAFRKEFDSMNAELLRLDAVRTLPDGFAYIDTSVMPESFVSLYGRMRSVGYANGWL